MRNESDLLNDTATAYVTTIMHGVVSACQFQIDSHP